MWMTSTADTYDIQWGLRDLSYGRRYCTSNYHLFIIVIIINWSSVYEYTPPLSRPCSCAFQAGRTWASDARLLRYDIAFLLRPGRGAKYCDQLVCLSVCVYVCACLSASISLEPLDRSSRFFCADPLWPWLGSHLAALRYIMYFRFYGWRHVWP